MKQMKQKINEQLRENMYLKGLLNGDIQGPLTNNITKDKPWLKNYTNKQILGNNTNKTLYEQLEINNKKSNKVALIQGNKKVTYSALIDGIDKVATSFKNLGVKKGDVVSLILPDSIKLVKCIYALNKIGAVANIIKDDIDSNTITKLINDQNSKIAVISKNLFNLSEGLLIDSCINKAIVVDSYFLDNKVIKKIKKFFFNTMVMSWNDFIQNKKTISTVKNSNILEGISIIEYDYNNDKPLPILLNNNQLILENEENKDNKVLSLIPLNITHGLAILHNTLCASNIYILNNKDSLIKKIESNKSDTIICHHNHYKDLIHLYLDLKSIKHLSVYGNNMTYDNNFRLLKYLKYSNLNINKVENSYNNDLVMSNVSRKRQLSKISNYVGIPNINVNVKLLSRNEEGEYDINTVSKPYDKWGTLFITTPNIDKYYTKHRSEYVYKDEKGINWLNTKEVFKMDDKGRLYYIDKEDNVIRKKDKKINLASIDKRINCFSFITTSATVVVKDEKGEEKIVSCVELNDRYVFFHPSYELAQYMYRNTTYTRPDVYILVNEIPYTPNGDINYKKVKEIATELIKDNNEEIIYAMSPIKRLIKR